MQYSRLYNDLVFASSNHLVLKKFVLHSSCNQKKDYLKKKKIPSISPKKGPVLNPAPATTG